MTYDLAEKFIDAMDGDADDELAWTRTIITAEYIDLDTDEMQAMCLYYKLGHAADVGAKQLRDAIIKFFKQRAYHAVDGMMKLQLDADQY
jgi:hypothetical protein